VTLVAGFASTVFIPLTQVQIEDHGWRPTLVAFAALQLLVCAPIHAFWLRDGGGRGQGGPLAAGNRARRAVRQPAFWGLALCFTATSAINAVIWFHAVPLFLERGFRPADVVAAMALIGPVQVAGRLVVFALGRRATTATYGRIALGLQPVVFAVPLVWSEALPGLFAFAILYGAVNGVMTVARATAIAEFLGLEGYGAISGLIAVPATIAHAGAPYATAFLWARFGGYGEVLVILFAVSLVATAGFWFAADRALRADKTLAGRAGVG
jgi:cyanate permease